MVLLTDSLLSGWQRSLITSLHSYSTRLFSISLRCDETRWFVDKISPCIRKVYLLVLQCLQHVSNLAYHYFDQIEKNLLKRSTVSKYSVWCHLWSSLLNVLFFQLWNYILQYLWLSEVEFNFPTLMHVASITITS
jgi:hypothetical protein